MPFDCPVKNIKSVFAFARISIVITEIGPNTDRRVVYKLRSKLIILIKHT